MTIVATWVARALAVAAVVLVCAPLGDEAGAQGARPAAPGSAPRFAGKTLAVEMAADSSLRFCGRAIAPDALLRRLEGLASDKGQIRIMLHADRDAAFARVKTVLQSLRDAGYSRISLVVAGARIGQDAEACR